MDNLRKLAEAEMRSWEQERGGSGEGPLMNTEATSIKLVCWHCGAAKEAIVPHPPQFAFQLAGWASDVGMVGYADMRYGRVLIFCNPEHARAEMTKQGMFRLRPKGAAAAIGSGE
jgi:hypothetical protein